jgi:hypothetical protein
MSLGIGLVRKLVVVVAKRIAPSNVVQALLTDVQQLLFAFPPSSADVVYFGKPQDLPHD